MLNIRLVSLRNSKNKTQQDLADYLGVTRPAYTAYERGTRHPDYDTLQKIANYYDVTTDYLLGRTESPKASINEDDARKLFYINKIGTEFPDIDLMFKDMNSLSSEELKEVYEYIKFKLSQKKEE